MTRRSRALCLAAAIALASSPLAVAFEGFIATDGSHLEITRTSLASVYGAPHSQPVFVREMPLWGITTYRWTPYRAADLLSDASRDIDSWYFGKLYPHAQTKDFPYGKDLSAEKLRAIESEALFDYVQHMGPWIERVRTLYRDGRDRDATWLLALWFHSYQDLWAHRGITNTMHKALLSHRGYDVDRHPERFALCRERFASLLADLPSILGAGAFSRFHAFLMSGDELSVPTVAEKGMLLHLWWRDIFTAGAAYKYLQGDSEKSLRYQKEIEWDVDALDRLLHDPVGLGEAVSRKNPASLALYLESRGYRF